MSSVAKNPVPTLLALTIWSLRCAGSKPSTETLVPHCESASNATVAVPTCVTPGSDCKLALDRVERLRLPLDANSRSSSGITLKVTIDSVRSPRSTRAMFARLCVNNAASTSSSIDNAICDVASAKRNRPRFLPPNARALPPCSARTGSVATSFDIGNSANTSVASTAIAKAAATARGSKLDAAGAQARRLQRVDRSQHAERDGQARDGREAREQQRFDGQERDEPAPRGTERRAHGDLADSRRAAREHQVREIHAADQQDRRGRREENRERRPAPVRGSRLWPRAPDTSERLFARNASMSNSGGACGRQRRLDVVDDRTIRRVSAACACSTETPGFKRPNT